ncbi:hypothetical protein [Rothia mucilaginosa]|uniref:IS1/IS1595 family N-terminal zinc-binding domain-containing protein n=1 Tax=Rothia mucilaginosa TaxID=43675 RepID=UPI0028D420DC|nr:hypothetical protein [Rothia mucilaginosa]
MGKWSKAAKLVSGVRDGLALLDDDERRRAIEALRSIMYEDMFGTGSQELPADACVRCGSISIIRKGHTGSSSQRWYCKDCGRTFTANVSRVLGASRLPVSTWMAYVEAFINHLSLRDCMDKCAVHIIECIQRHNPSFNAVAGDRVEIDETYFRDSYKGYRKGTRPRPARKSGKKAMKRGLSKQQQVCVVTGIDDTDVSFLVVSGRGMLDKECAYQVLNGRIGKGALAVLDRLGATLERTDATEHAINRINSPSLHARIKDFMHGFKGVCPRSTSSPTSHGPNGPRRSRAAPPNNEASSDARSSATACTGSRAACTCACPCPCDGR